CPWPYPMGGVTLKAPINEFSGGFFVTNSTDGELHDFWITEHCSEHRNVLMGQLPCNQPLCFKQWHSSLPVLNAELNGRPSGRSSPEWGVFERFVRLCFAELHVLIYDRAYRARWYFHPRT